MKKLHFNNLTEINKLLYHKNELFTGISVLEYNGEIGYVEDEVESGFMNGVFNHFYRSGILCKNVNYKPNGPTFLKSDVQGKFETFYDDGKLCEKGEIIEGEMVGEYECCYENENAFIKASFDKNSVFGEGICYYRNGKIAQKGDIWNRPFAHAVARRILNNNLTPSTKGAPIRMPYGIPHGDHVLSESLYNSNQFDFAPPPRRVPNFRSFNKEGVVITFIRDYIKQCYNSKGILTLVESFNDKLQRHGQRCEYTDYGDLGKIESYYNDVLDGVYLEFRSQGFIYKKGSYKAGKEVGEWEYFDDKGLLAHY